MIRSLQKRIDEYRSGDPDSFTPFRIDFKVRPPIFLAWPWIYLDGIIQHLCTRDALGEDLYNLPTNHLFSFEKMQLPLKRTDDVYHASVGIYETAKTRMTRIYKRFEEYYLQFHPELQKRKYSIGAGYFKNHMINYPILLTRKVTFHGCGDIEEIQRLAEHLTHLGKKSGIGAGKIQSHRIKEEKEDHSFYMDGYGVMRPIPTTLNPPPPKKEGQVWMKMTYKPPYWDQRHATLCWAPRNQLDEAFG